MMRMMRRQGFTLIELLVVVSIIGLLSTLLLANFNAARERARDVQRKSDLRNIQTALRLYYNDCGKYPTGAGGINGCGTCAVLSSCDWDGETPFATNDQIYMNILPQDPQYDADTGVSYTYTSTDDETYTLSACLENKSDDKCGADCNSGDGCTYTVSP